MINRCNINIAIEKDVLKMNLKIQSFFKRNILVYMEKISDDAINSFNSSSGTIAYTYLKRVQDLLSKADENIECINNLINNLNRYSAEFTDNDLDSFVTSYNEDYVRCMQIVTQNSLDIQNLLNELFDYIKFDFSFFNNVDLLNNLPNSSIINDTDTQNIDVEVDKRNLDNETLTINTEELPKDFKENVLFISDIKQKVVLPYTLSELKNILINDNSYSSLQDIIDKKYTIPISYYKNSAISRFKEAYSLVKNRSSGAIKEAFDLGLEVFFKFDLNPAIITACKNIDELDIYLSCLDDDEIDNFKCFDIVYECFPTVK